MHALMNVRDAVLGVNRYCFVEGSDISELYPVDLDFTLDDPAAFYQPFDDSGIPQKRYKSVGVQYNPTRVASLALASFNRFMTAQDEVSRETFIRMADWFAAVPDSRWVYQFDWGPLQSPWISCMAQGEGISVLCRAYSLLGDDAYLKCAIRALEPMEVDIENGGVRSKIDGTWPFLEEYPTPLDQSHTLNGFLYALIGLSDLESLAPETVNSVGIQDLVGSLVANLPRWNLSGWSAYDLSSTPSGRRNYATLNYHNLHISQIRYLGLRYGQPELLSMAERWSISARSSWKRLRGLYGKVRYRLQQPPQR